MNLNTYRLTICTSMLSFIIEYEVNALVASDQWIITLQRVIEAISITVEIGTKLLCLAVACISVSWPLCYASYRLIPLFPPVVLMIFKFFFVKHPQARPIILECRIVFIGYRPWLEVISILFESFSSHV